MRVRSDTRLLQTRRAGVVLHPTSLPGPHGCGDLGETAWRFADWLASAGQTLWQMLPLNPAGPGHSPYQSPSAFAGNPLLVALEPLVEAGWLAEIQAPAFDEQRVDYAHTTAWRWQQLRAAAAGFFAQADNGNSSSDHDSFEAWCAHENSWLDNWALFAALKDAHGGQPWWLWAPALARRDPTALAAARVQHAQAMRTHRFVQWCFDCQAAALKAHANSQGLLLMGDLPIFVAHDSADVWARPDYFELDAEGQPTVVAGVPPDGYSPTGQRWGNPLYCWQRMAEDGYAWWVARVRRALAHSDVFRIDHFRGFAGYWEIPATCPTAEQGRWAPGPGAALFQAIEAALGKLPIVAEDLGLITPDVVALREQFAYPGMRIVQEAFQRDAAHDFLPHNYAANTLAYSSTHDSDTAAGWWAAAPASQRAYAAEYLRCSADAPGADVAWALMHAAHTSVANLALAPLQDVLGLGGAHRMNLPGTADGNWGWRFTWNMLGNDLAHRLKRLAVATGRSPWPVSPSAF
jgi:4-alpha-glucanotransferase